MSAKISALSATTEIFTADLLTGVQGGVNVKFGRDELLAVPSTDSMLATFGSSGVELNGTGVLTVSIDIGDQLAVEFGGTQILTVVNGTPITLRGNASGFAIVVPGGGLFTISNSGTINIQCAPGQSLAMAYAPGNPANWGGVSPPSDIWIAIDRIAAAVAGLLGTPIP